VWVTSAAERRAGVVEMSRRAAERDQIGLLLRSAMGAWAGVASKAGKARAVVMRAMARWRGDALWDGFVAFSGLLREKKERDEWAKSYKVRSALSFCFLHSSSDASDAQTIPKRSARALSSCFFFVYPRDDLQVLCCNLYVSGRAPSRGWRRRTRVPAV
jgi:hypothetical protein